MSCLWKIISNIGVPVRGVRGGNIMTFKLLFFVLILSIWSEPVSASDFDDDKKKVSIDVIGEITPLFKPKNKVSGTVSNYAPTATISGTTTVCKDATTYVTFTGSGGVAPYTFSYFVTGTALPQLISTSGGSSSVDLLVNTSSVNRTFTLIGVTDDIGDNAAASGSATVTVVNPTAIISGGPLTICQNVVGTNLTVTFFWRHCSVYSHICNKWY